MDSRWLPKGYKSNRHLHKFISLWIGARPSLMRAQRQVLEVGPTHHVMSEHSLLSCIPSMAYSKHRERRDQSRWQVTVFRILEGRVAEPEGTWLALEKWTVGIRMDSKAWEEPAGAMGVHTQRLEWNRKCEFHLIISNCFSLSWTHPISY